MEKKDLTPEELNMFEVKIKQRFNDEKFMQGAKGHAYVISKEHSECIENKYSLEIILVSANKLKKNQDILDTIKPKQIIMYGEEQYPYYYLFRHLHNCVCDIENKIEKEEIEGVLYYVFTDRYPKTNTISMKGIIPVEVFEQYIDDIYQYDLEYYKQQNN